MKSRSFVFELRYRRVEYKTNNVPLIINAFGGATKRTKRETEGIFRLCKTTVTDMKNTISMDAETII